MKTTKPQDYNFKSFYGRIRIVLSQQLSQYLINFNPDAEIKLNTNILIRPYTIAATEVAMRHALKGYNEAKESDLKKALDPVDFLQARWKTEIVKRAGAKAYDASKMLDKTTKAKIKFAIVYGKRNNFSNTELANYIESEIGKLNEGRARNIARTESTTWANYGKRIGANDYFKSTKQEGYKYWVHGKTKDPRATHEAMVAKKPIKNNEPFDVDGEKMQYPGDDSASAKNRCNCFCTANYISDAVFNRRYGNNAPTVPVEDIQPVPPTIENIPSIQVEKPSRVTKSTEIIVANTHAQASKALTEMFENSNAKIKIRNMTIDPKLKGPALSNRVNKLNELINEYDIPVFNENDGGIRLILRSDRDQVGGIRYGSWINKDTLSRRDFNFGSKDLITANGNRETTFNVILPFQAKDHYTVVHEFGHVLTGLSDEALSLELNASKDVIDKSKAFWDEVKAIEKDYYKAIETNASEFRISGYAHVDSDEFVAESFTEYKLHPNPSKYAKMVGELIGKYFKK